MKPIIFLKVLLAITLVVAPLNVYCQLSHRNPFVTFPQSTCFAGGQNLGNGVSTFQTQVILQGSPPRILSVLAPDTLRLPESGFSLFLIQATVADSDGLQDIQSVWFLSPNSSNPLTAYFLGNRGGSVWSDTFQISSENRPGAYPLVFTARDNEGNLSDQFVHTVIVTGPPTFIFAGSKAKPTGFQLFQNFPNPFNPSTTLTFTLTSASFVSLKVYDLLGSNVATLVYENLLPGVYSRRWDAHGMPSGIYICRLDAGFLSSARKIILLK